MPGFNFHRTTYPLFPGLCWTHPVMVNPWEGWKRSSCVTLMYDSLLPSNLKIAASFGAVSDVCVCKYKQKYITTQLLNMHVHAHACNEHCLFVCTVSCIKPTTPEESSPSSSIFTGSGESWPNGHVLLQLVQPVRVHGSQVEVAVTERKDEKLVRKSTGGNRPASCC